MRPWRWIADRVVPPTSVSLGRIDLFTAQRREAAERFRRRTLALVAEVRSDPAALHLTPGQRAHIVNGWSPTPRRTSPIPRPWFLAAALVVLVVALVLT